MGLKSGTSEGKAPVFKRAVELAPPDEHKIHQIAGELDEQSHRRVVLACPEPGIGKPDAVPPLLPVRGGRERNQMHGWSHQRIPFRNPSTPEYQQIPWREVSGVLGPSHRYQTRSHPFYSSPRLCSSPRHSTTAHIHQMVVWAFCDTRPEPVFPTNEFPQLSPNLFKTRMHRTSGGERRRGTTLRLSEIECWTDGVRP
jgi:hypothetical protein